MTHLDLNSVLLGLSLGLLIASLVYLFWGEQQRRLLKREFEAIHTLRKMLEVYKDTAEMALNAQLERQQDDYDDYNRPA